MIENIGSILKRQDKFDLDYPITPEEEKIPGKLYCCDLPQGYFHSYERSMLAILFRMVHMKEYVKFVKEYLKVERGVCSYSEERIQLFVENAIEFFDVNNWKIKKDRIKNSYLYEFLHEEDPYFFLFDKAWKLIHFDWKSKSEKMDIENYIESLSFGPNGTVFSNGEELVLVE